MDEVDAALARIEELDGTIVGPAFDSPDVGRMAFIEDPTSARVALMTAVEVGEPA
ncbi:MAG: hypothetical protein HKN04_06290 [Rhodothermaceae bacterium]|nr:hypothetical protein [Rhodothermaceae bacterium]